MIIDFNKGYIIFSYSNVTRNGLSFQVTWQVMWPPHGHRHMAQPPLAGSRAGSRAKSCAGLCDELCARLWRYLWPWEFTRALGLRVLSAALSPLAPTATLSLWPMATFSSWPTPFVNHGQWRPSFLGGPWRRGALGPWRSLTYGSLWPMGHPWSR